MASRCALPLGLAIEIDKSPQHSLAERAPRKSHHFTPGGREWVSERVRSKSAQSGCVTPSTPPHNLPSSQAHHENAEHSVPRSFFPSPSGFGVKQNL